VCVIGSAVPAAGRESKDDSEGICVVGSPADAGSGVATEGVWKGLFYVQAKLFWRIPSQTELKYVNSWAI